jgi:hypothetical protein
MQIFPAPTNRANAFFMVLRATPQSFAIRPMDGKQP